MKSRRCSLVLNPLLVAAVFFLSSLSAFAAEGNVPLRLRILTYNIQIGRAPGGSYSNPAEAHLDRTAKTISEAQPDVAGLQEVDCKTDRSGSETDQLMDLATLTGMVGTFAPKTKLPGGDYGIGVLSKKEPLSSRVILLEGSAHTRALQILEFEDYVFFNTHLPLTPEKRLDAVAKIEEEAQKYDKPIILVGDLNAEPDSKEIQLLEKNWKNLGPDAATFPAPNPTARIDYIFIRNVKSCKIIKTEVVPDPNTSDHRPVFCEIEAE